MRAARACMALGALALACASEPPPTAGQFARVSVEVLRGFSAEDLEPVDGNAPAVVLLDATSSMLAPTGAGASHYLAAQRGATRFANDLPSQRAIWLYAVGSADAPECQPVFRGTRAENAAARGPLLEEILGVQPRGEGSLAEALDRVREELSRSDALMGSRIAVFSDLVSSCGGDLCAAAAKVIQGGARLDVVAIGDTPAPACLREPTGLAETLPPPKSIEHPVHYRLEVAKPEPMVVGCSDAGGLPVAAPPGRGTVVVELDPPLRVEANFEPGRRHLLQVIDFPTLDPETRHWRWVESPASGTQAARTP